MTKDFSIENEALVLNTAWPDHQKLELQVGNWAELFNEQEIKVIIAVALNHCAHHEELKIIGYLITAEKVSLIVVGNKEQWDKVSIIFYELTARGITDILKSERFGNDNTSICNKEGYEHQLNELYRINPLTNQYLTLLITGAKN